MRRVVQFVTTLVLPFLLATTFLSIAVAVPLPSPYDLISSGHMDDAIRVLKARVASAPNDAEAYHLLARTYYHTRNWDQAIEFGERAVDLAPNNSDYHLWLGRAYGEKASDSSWVTAIRLAKKVRAQFEQAVSLDTRNVPAHTDLAEYYVEAPGFLGGGTDKAENQAAQLSTLDKPKAHWVNARVAEKKKDLTAAENEYKKAIQESQSADDWLSLASFYRRQDRLSDMDAAINKALLAPNRPANTLYDAATLFYRTDRNLPAAADLIRKYLASGNTSEDAPAFQAHYTLGLILEKQGNSNGAVGEYRASLALASNFKPAQDALNRVSGQSAAGR